MGGGGGVIGYRGRSGTVSPKQTNTLFVVSLACVVSPAGDRVHLVHLVMEPNGFWVFVVK